MRARLLAVVLAALAASPDLEARASVKPHGLFRDGAVLQQGTDVPVWGTAAEGERVTVRLQGQEATTTATGGRWMVRLKPLQAGGPFALTVAGDTVVEVRNVLVGEVWIATGQSNMEMPLAEAAGGAEEVARSADPMLRQLAVPVLALGQRGSDVEGEWKEAGPASAGAFSAVAYYFGRDLRRRLGVPVGVVTAAVGRTSARAWVSRTALEASPELRRIVEAWDEGARRYPEQVERYRRAVEKGKRVPPPQPRSPAEDQNRPAGLYNGMVAPLQPYAIRGVICYQGESNTELAHQYRTLFPALIRSWREEWHALEFPFLFVQLAPYTRIEDEPSQSDWAELREAQLLTSLTVPRTAMVVTADVGDETNPHPKQKEPVGARLALAARAVAYGEAVVYSGPVYDAVRPRGAGLVLSFRNVGGGLVARGGALTGFTIAGADRRFVKAEARIEGDTVVVSSPRVRTPIAARYGWADYPVVNLCNREGLPASPFRTDDFPMPGRGRKVVTRPFGGATVSGPWRGGRGLR